MKRAVHVVPADAQVHFTPSSFPVCRWNVQWWDELQKNYFDVGRISKLPAPYSEAAMPEAFMILDGCGPYYSFDRDGYHFICLDTCRVFLEKTQLAWLKREVATHKNQPTLICMHHSILPTGSIWDSGILWNHPEIVGLVKANPAIIAVLTGHVHHNRIWDFNGAKVIATGMRCCRNICLKNGRVDYVEPLEEYETPIPKFRGNYFVPSEVHAPSFRCMPGDLWNFPGIGDPYAAFGWISHDGVGGLAWRLEIVSEQAGRAMFIGASFATHSPWELSIADETGGLVYRRSGGGSGSAPINISEGVEFKTPGEYVARLTEQPPAKGHACMFFSIAHKKMTGVNVY